MRLPVLTPTGDELVRLDVQETDTIISVYDRVSELLHELPDSLFRLSHGQHILFEDETTLASHHVRQGETLTLFVIDEGRRFWQKRQEAFRNLDLMLDCARGIQGALRRRTEETQDEHAQHFRRLRETLVVMFYRLGGARVEEAVKVAEAHITTLLGMDPGITFFRQVENLRKSTMAVLDSAAALPLERRLEVVSMLALTVDLILQDMRALRSRASKGGADSDSDSEPEFMELRRDTFYAEWLEQMMKNLPDFEMDWPSLREAHSAPLPLDPASCWDSWSQESNADDSVGEEDPGSTTSSSRPHFDTSRPMSSLPEVPRQEKSQSSSGNGDTSGMSREEATSYTLGRSTPAPGTEPEPFHSALPPEPVEAGFLKLDPQKKYKFVIFKERNTNRSVQDMMSPGAKTTRTLLEERTARQTPNDPLSSAIHFVRGYRWEDFLPDSSADEKQRARAKKHVVVRAKTGCSPLTQETVRFLHMQLNALILDIVGRGHFHMVGEDSYLSVSEDETDEGQTTPDPAQELHYHKSDGGADGGLTAEPMRPPRGDNGGDSATSSKCHAESQSQSESRGLEGRLTPTPDVHAKPEVFHAVTGTGGALQPVSSGWNRLLPFERQDLEALEVWKFVTFRERNTHRSIQEMLQPETMALPGLLHWGMALPVEVEVRVNRYDTDFRTKFQQAVRFVRRFRLQEYPAEWVQEDDRAKAVGVARQRVVVKGGEENLTVPSVHHLDWALNTLILAILGRDDKGKKPELVMLDGTLDMDEANGDGTGQGTKDDSGDHFPAVSGSCCVAAKEPLHLLLKVPPRDGSESEKSTSDDTCSDGSGDSTRASSSSSADSGNSSRGCGSGCSSSSSSGGSGGATKYRCLVCRDQPLGRGQFIPGPPLDTRGTHPEPSSGSNPGCRHVATNCISAAKAEGGLSAARVQQSQEASNASASASAAGKRVACAFAAGSPTPTSILQGDVQGQEPGSDMDSAVGASSEAAEAPESEPEDEVTSEPVEPPPQVPMQGPSESSDERLTVLLDVFLPQDGDGEHDGEHE